MKNNDFFIYSYFQKKPMLIIPYFIYRILYLNFTFIISVLLTCAGILGLEVLSSMTNVTVWDTKISYSNEFTNFFKGFSIFLVILGILLFCEYSCEGIVFKYYIKNINIWRKSGDILIYKKFAEKRYVYYLINH